MKNAVVQASSNQRTPAEITADDKLSTAEAALELFKEYARERPEVVALWAFGIGFVLGWKLKPW
jgi:hypothetical protein